MAVLSCEEMPGRPASWTGGGARCQRRYKLVTDERTDDGIVVMGHIDLPVPGMVHPVHSFLYCTGLSAEESILNLKQDEGETVAGGSLWYVTADYSSVLEEISTSSNPLYPTTPAKYNGNSSLEYKGIDYDKNGDAIANLAGDPFRPRLQAWFPNDTLEIEVNLLFGSLVNSNTYMRRVNSATYKGKAAGTVMCVACNYSGPFQQGGVTYYVQRLSLSHAEETWNVRHGKVLQQGLREKVGGVLRTIRDDDQNEVTEPRMLKTSGGDVVKTDDPAEAEWLSVQLYASVSFAGIDY
jgi:hypothetical protein